MQQFADGRCEVENQYARVVPWDGNTQALGVMADVFALRPHFEWRGLGFISHSALKLSERYADFDTELRYEVPGVRVAAHITGGGLEENVPRVLPDDLAAHFVVGAWDVPPVFGVIAADRGLAPAEMHCVFNMGIGYCIVVRPTFAEAVKARLERYGERVHVIGQIAKGKGRVVEK